MTEFNKLENYLKKANCPYERIDTNDYGLERHMIFVPNEKELAKKLSKLAENFIESINRLDDISAKVPDKDAYETAKYYRDTVIPEMDTMRRCSDELETVVGKDFWPFPTYTELLYSII